MCTPLKPSLELALRRDRLTLTINLAAKMGDTRHYGINFEGRTKKRGKRVGKEQGMNGKGKRIADTMDKTKMAELCLRHS